MNVSLAWRAKLLCWIVLFENTGNLIARKLLKYKSGRRSLALLVLGSIRWLLKSLGRNNQRTPLGLEIALPNVSSPAKVTIIRNYFRAFGDGPCNFEPWSSEEVDTGAGTPLSYLPTPTGGCWSIDNFNVRRPPLLSGSSAVLGSNS
ncbi:hypothetical protein TNCV_888301 [Trichonephila clavipes]|nr:hypothetical protein TNCV_888301 [Trichonephila clavipes]